MRQLLTLVLVAICSVVSAAELSLSEKKIVNTVNASVRNAGVDYLANKFDSAGNHIRAAMKQINEAMKSGSPDLQKALMPAIGKVSKAHAMLEFEGISLPPFVKPTAAKSMPSKSVATKPTPTPSPAPATPSPTPTTPDPNMISFTNQVGPILANRCGRCHIQGARGQFSLGTFAALMKGPPEGVVVFAGDTIGSRLIETIETGDMPRGGGKVSPQELAILKGWIMQGAKFDGQDPNAPISANAPTTPQNNRMPEVKRATGNETVSFSRDVAPLLVDNCTGCHIDAMRNQGGLRMDSFSQMLRGGDSGEIVLPGRGADSLLVKKLRGMEGNRMPAGGRPALADKDIQLISTWIDEGATLDAGTATQPIKVMAQLAWASNATAAQMNERRQKLAKTNLGLVVPSDASVQIEDTKHFHVVGTAAPGTIKLVAQKAEAHMAAVRSIARGGAGEEYFHGKATIFVMPQRYDYSEFAKMVEKRDVPSDWKSHWRFDGVDAYIAVVASGREEPDDIEQRLLPPLASLAVATRGSGVPRWFAEGVGTMMAGRKAAQDRQAKMQMQSETAEALATCKDAKAFLGGRLTPVHTDRLGAAMIAKMMDRSSRKSFDNCMRLLSSGTPFESAFAKSFRAPVNTWINGWLKWAGGR